ncbi:MAG TPA: ribosomal protein S18-alanine N-acetyltransferase [Candidatus Acidoferrales bacterium]|nr:ribosomal protein S18-alanine N-acetyltransferase [Candidatus Acidoferrales bacterium]
MPNSIGRATRDVVSIRRLELSDIEDVLAIQRACPEVAQWSASDYERSVSGAMAGWVSEDDAGLSGFLVARSLLGESEILNFGVRPDARGRGIGSQLLQEVIEWSKRGRDRRILLEVRASNVVAQSFYARLGFQIVGRRGRYYSNPTEEALLLDRAL